MIVTADKRDPRVGQANLFDGRKILSKQARAISALSLRSPVKTCALLGGWGSGKTTTESVIALASAAENPWREAYGESRPCTLIMTVTAAVLRDSIVSAIKQTFPRGVIVKERAVPAWDLLLANGHVLALRSDAGSTEGLNVCTTIIDEVHRIRDKERYLNYAARARDPLAKKNMVFVAGLPIDNGWLREEFDRPNDPSYLTLYMRTAENTHLPAGYVDTLRSRCSIKEAKTLLDAEWHQSAGAIYDEFDSSKHFVRDEGDRNQYVHLGIDVGHRGAVVVFQTRQRIFRGKQVQGLHVVDEVLCDHATTEATMREFFKRGWQLSPSYPGREGSVICVDPKTSTDQIEGIYRACMAHGVRDVHIVKKNRGDPAENVKTGVRSVKTAFCDANGLVRLTLSDQLGTHDRGLRRAIPKYRWNENTSEPVKDNMTDHVLDALRYPVVHFLPNFENAIRVVDDYTMGVR